MMDPVVLAVFSYLFFNYVLLCTFFRCVMLFIRIVFKVEFTKLDRSVCELQLNCKGIIIVRK